MLMYHRYACNTTQTSYIILRKLETSINDLSQVQHNNHKHNSFKSLNIHFEVFKCNEQEL